MTLGIRSVLELMNIGEEKRLSCNRMGLFERFQSPQNCVNVDKGHVYLYEGKHRHTLIYIYNYIMF